MVPQMSLYTDAKPLPITITTRNMFTRKICIKLTFSLKTGFATLPFKLLDWPTWLSTVDLLNSNLHNHPQHLKTSAEFPACAVHVDVILLTTTIRCCYRSSRGKESMVVLSDNNWCFLVFSPEVRGKQDDFCASSIFGPCFLLGTSVWSAAGKTVISSKSSFSELQL